MDRIKTVCTIGPASEEAKILERLVAGGLDIARMNFSHCSRDEFKNRKRLIERFNSKYGRDVKIMQDLQGPRIRVGVLPGKGVKLCAGDEIVFSGDSADKKAIFIDDPYLCEDIKIGETIFLSNGDMELVVVKKSGRGIKAKVKRGGILYSRKSVNLPDTDLRMGSITEKDFKDVDFALAQGVDYVALSFVKSGEDIARLREYINNSAVKIIAKIERKMAVANLDGIIDASDVVMIARGDLGIEMPIEELPITQKDIITRCKIKGKPTIVATQMMMSMVNNPMPTRAEISDIANAVLDGASALMLSDETAFGKYPEKALEFLTKTIKRTEEFQFGGKWL